MEKYLTMTPLWGATRYRRLATGVTAILSAVFLVGVLSTSPVLAADKPTSLPSVGGHRCTTVLDDGSENFVLCADLALYTSSTGQQSITLQIEAICQSDSGGYLQCQSATLTGSVANGGGYYNPTFMNCVLDCQKGTRNFFYPFGGLAISLGGCDQNVWGVIENGSGGKLPDGNFKFTSNTFATLHYEVCENSPGVLTYHQVT